jgi:uncharacterized HAD superfamily protein
MKIGIDLDDVLVLFMEGFLDFLKKEKGMDYNEEDFIVYDFWKIFNIEKEKSKELVHLFYDSKDFDDLGVVEDAVDIIKRLSEKNQIFFITSRHPKLREKTERFIKNYFLDMDFELYFSGDFFKRGKTKSELCESLGISFFIDDNFNYVKEIANKEIKTFLFDKPWNRDENTQVHEKIIRVKSWKEIFEKFKEIENEN